MSQLFDYSSGKFRKLIENNFTELYCLKQCKAKNDSYVYDGNAIEGPLSHFYQKLNSVKFFL